MKRAKIHRRERLKKNIHTTLDHLIQLLFYIIKMLINLSISKNTQTCKILKHSTNLFQ